MIHYKGALIIGGLIGTGLGILLAPEKGRVTRDTLKKESKSVKDKLVDDFNEVKDDLSKSAESGKAKLKENIKKLGSDTSIQTERVITFLEKQLGNLKEKNRTWQRTS